MVDLISNRTVVVIRIICVALPRVYYIKIKIVAAGTAIIWYVRRVREIFALLIAILLLFLLTLILCVPGKCFLR